MSLRQPIELPVEFGPQLSMLCFLYNQGGTQAIPGRSHDKMALTGPSPIVS